ncbi:3,5-dihydroxyphenylacetyl-CoA synthase DpgA [Collimonas pratensis]|uniref:3,5-dihydroxyphenylacetyl-CoA synthase DpgA n=1 Tax=Collimonas pratensis TaxID=279113 RepID=UPI00197FE9C9
MTLDLTINRDDYARSNNFMARAKILGVGTSTSGTRYSQEDILDIYQIEDPRIKMVFRGGKIENRYLTLPQHAAEEIPSVETQGQLLKKHSDCAQEIGARALLACLDGANASIGDIDYLCCVTTTGLLTPGLSALLCKKLNLSVECARLDVVGMGCNAGLNGLNATASWAQANPGKMAVMLCVEICSAAYVFDGTMQTAVVNSLFGDGASAVAVVAGEPTHRLQPTILKFSSRVVTDALDAMKFTWDEGHGKFSFFLAQDVPYVVGAHVEGVIDSLLVGTNLRRDDIAHWIVHSGGKKVIDAIQINLGLPAHEMRHTSAVLRDFGNMSSGSFLFSYQRLLAENVIETGDYGVMMTMGPGTTIETALLRW